MKLDVHDSSQLSLDFNIPKLEANTWHCGARHWLFPKDLQPCLSTSAHTLPSWRSSELYSRELSYFKPAAHQRTVSSSRPSHIVFSPAFIHLLFVILPTHGSTETTEILDNFLSIWLLEWHYERISAFIRKREVTFWFSWL